MKVEEQYGVQHYDTHLANTGTLNKAKAKLDWQETFQYWNDFNHLLLSWLLDVHMEAKLYH